MDGKDPWTGEEGSTWRLAVGGVTDLLTMGFAGAGRLKALNSLRDIVELPAVTNILSNVVQEVIERVAPEYLEEIGLSRETLDIILSLSGDDKHLKMIEVVSNLIQAGLVTEDVVKKYLESSLTKEDLIFQKDNK